MSESTTQNLLIGSRWREREYRFDQRTGKKKAKRIVYIHRLFKRYDGVPMLDYGCGRSPRQRDWYGEISKFVKRYEYWPNDKLTVPGQ